MSIHHKIVGKLDEQAKEKGNKTTLGKAEQNVQEVVRRIRQLDEGQAFFSSKHLVRESEDQNRKYEGPGPTQIGATLNTLARAEHGLELYSEKRGSANLHMLQTADGTREEAIGKIKTVARHVENYRPTRKSAWKSIKNGQNRLHEEAREIWDKFNEALDGKTSGADKNSVWTTTSKILSDEEYELQSTDSGYSRFIEGLSNIGGTGVSTIRPYGGYEVDKEDLNPEKLIRAADAYEQMS
jgi:hypothetical protein